MPEKVRQDSGGYMRSVYNGAVLGGFSEDESKTAGLTQIGVGMVPIAGQLADLRDTAAAVRDVCQGKPGSWGDLGFATLGWIPVVGDGAKACRRLGLEGALRAAGEAISKAVSWSTVKEIFGASVATAKQVISSVPLQMPTRVREGIREAWAGFKAEGFGGITKGWDSVYERNPRLSAERVALEADSMNAALSTGADIGEVLAREPHESGPVVGVTN